MTWHTIKIVRNIRSGLENLLLHKLRSFLTMLGVVFGVGSVVAMLSVGEGAGREALEHVSAFAFDACVVDLRLPDADGLDILKAAIERYPDMLALVIAVLSGVVFGLLPARRAARLDPVVALAGRR